MNPANSEDIPFGVVSLPELEQSAIDPQVVVENNISDPPDILSNTTITEAALPQTVSDLPSEILPQAIVKEEVSTQNPTTPISEEFRKGTISVDLVKAEASPMEFSADDVELDDEAIAVNPNKKPAILDETAIVPEQEAIASQPKSSDDEAIATEPIDENDAEQRTEINYIGKTVEYLSRNIVVQSIITEQNKDRTLIYPARGGFIDLRKQEVKIVG